MKNCLKCTLPYPDDEFIHRGKWRDPLWCTLCKDKYAREFKRLHSTRSEPVPVPGEEPVLVPSKHVTKKRRHVDFKVEDLVTFHTQYGHTTGKIIRFEPGGNWPTAVIIVHQVSGKPKIYRRPTYKLKSFKP